MCEIWVDVEGYDGVYQVSDLGRVRSVRKTTWGLKVIILKLYEDKRGYLYVGLHKKGKAKNVPVHHLVLNAFVGPRPEGMECCHFPDRDPKNNCLDNLRWDTRKGNHSDKKLHGTTGLGRKMSKNTREKMSISARKQNRVGSKNPYHKLTEEEVVEIRKRCSEGVTKRELAEEYDVSPSAISGIVRRISWNHI